MRSNPAAHPITLVQAVAVSWTKASRGGDSATLRNRVPDAFRAPVKEVTDTTLLFHRVYFGEKNAFRAPTNEFVDLKEFTKPFIFGCVKVFPSGKSIGAVYEHTGEGGAPDRFGRFEIELEPGQWGRFQYNDRFVDFDNGTWWYEKWTFNVGLFQQISPGVFLKNDPIKSYSQMELLF